MLLKFKWHSFSNSMVQMFLNRARSVQVVGSLYLQLGESTKLIISN